MKAMKAVCLLAVLNVVGCATLRIDVDVYKGPLADHETVQVQRLFSMANGAHPLLVSMRDELEWRRGH